jgi:hypothetical protein
MVHGETYYVKLTTNPPISMSGYTGTYQVVTGAGIELKTGAMVTGDNYIEMTVPTADIPKGSYYIRSFITYPDGFIQCASNEQVDITF